MTISVPCADALARPLQIGFAPALYHVATQGNHRQLIHHCNRDRQRFLDRLADGLRTQRLWVRAFVPMRNYDHLLAKRPEPTVSRPWVISTAPPSSTSTPAIVK